MLALAVLFAGAITGGICLLHPPSSTIVPFIAVLHVAVAAALVPRPKQVPGFPLRVSRLAPVISFFAFLGGSLGFLAWLSASVFWTEVVPPAKILGAGLLSLTTASFPVLLLRQGDTPFADGDDKS